MTHVSKTTDPLDTHQLEEVIRQLKVMQILLHKNCSNSATENIKTIKTETLKGLSTLLGSTEPLPAAVIRTLVQLILLPPDKPHFPLVQIPRAETKNKQSQRPISKLSRFIQAYRRQHEMTQDALRQFIGEERAQYISKVEQGSVKNPDSAFLEKLSKITKISVDELLQMNDDFGE